MLADRYADHTGLSVLSRTKRAEYRDVGQRLGERTAALARVANELQTTEADAARRAEFLRDHAADLAWLDPIESELDHRIACRVAQSVVDPPDSYVRTLGPVPPGGEALAAWKRGATILESHHLGCDRVSRIDESDSMLGSPSELAVMRARLETLPFWSNGREVPSRAAERAVDLGL